MPTFTRREVVNSLVASAVSAALGHSLPGAAQPVEAESEADRRSVQTWSFLDFRKFVAVSAALTGIRAELLAPDANAKLDPNTKSIVPSGADPNQSAKLAYFQLALRDTSYVNLLRESGISDKEPLAVPPTIGDVLLNNKDPGVARLARSIIMAWYFGVWYEWDVPQGDKKVDRFTVISADAYTEGWVWRIAQAHPMGYSNLRFGHWALPPSAGFALDQIKA